MADPIEQPATEPSEQAAPSDHSAAETAVPEAATVSVSGDAATPSEQAHEAVTTSDAAEGSTLPEGSGVDVTASGADSADSGDPADADAGEGATDAATSDAGERAAPEEGKKKRKRRRRKGGTGATAAGETSPGTVDASGEGRARRKDGAPFHHLFTGALATKRHGFAVGEVVAGRVKQVEGGAIVVDLFGKALAIVDALEPREVPTAPALATPIVQEAGEAPPLDASEAASSETEASAATPGASTSESAPEQPASEPGVEATADAVAPADDVAPVEAADVDSSSLPLATEALDATNGSGHALESDAGLEGAAGDDDAESDEDEASSAARGPMTPLPVVPDVTEPPELPSVGQVFRGRVGATSESGHIALVNRLVDRAAALVEIERCRVQRRRVEGLVFGWNRGGFDVLVAGTRAFCPASAMSLGEIPDPNAHVGQKYEFLVPAGQPVKDDVIVSRRSILERQLRKLARERLKELAPGQRHKGRVTHVREFGLIVDIGGIDGLVHLSELSWTHGVRPADVAKPGDEVEVQVLRIGAEPGRSGEGNRRERNTRIGLSIKALLPDPWDAYAETLREGTVHKGKVTRATDFGAFIELLPSVEGLLHITELGRDLKHASMAVQEGDELHVVIERLDRKARRISLSKLSSAEIAEYEAGSLEEGARSVRPGARVTVKVERVEPRGLLVRVQGVVGRRARGFVPRSEMGEHKGGDMRKAFPQGSTLEVKVLGIDRDGGLRCSPKALQVDDERKAIKDYRRDAAKQGFGTFGDLLRAKLGEAGPK